LKGLALWAHEKGLELACHVAPAVPDHLHGDLDRLRQVIVNLVGNAVKFTERGEVVVSVTVATGGWPAGEAQTGAPPVATDVLLRFEVRDTGIGIPKDKQETIFNAFEQVDSSTTRRHGGTGLGLAISSRLAEMMGGRLEVESEPGR